MQTAYSKKWNLKIPAILAPLSGGPGSPELVAACCNAGIFGFFGGAYLSAKDLRSEIQKIKSLTTKPFGVNLFTPSTEPKLSQEQIRKAIDLTKKYRDELGLSEPKVGPPYFEDWEKQLEVILSEKPAAFSFTFGLISEKDLQRLKQAGIEVIGTATTLKEALLLRDLGVDAICLQGTEAGGHRGMFSDHDPETNLGIRDLLKQCAKEIKLPLIAAGGLMTGADVHEVLLLGAQAAQMGTAFLLCAEAAVSKPYREELRKKTNTTKLTRVFSGRFARGLENRFMREMPKEEILPWPTLNFFTRDLRKKSAEQNKSDFLSLWAGTGIAKIRELSASDLIKVISDEFHKVSQS